MKGLLGVHGGFRRLWIGDALSKVGGQVPLLAVPVLAAVGLGASTWQVALLGTSAYLPLLLIGLPVGAWADRMRRRHVLVLADVGRAVALLYVPVAAALDVLTVEQLYAVEFVVGVGTVVFDVFLGAFVPVLVGRAKLVDANARLEINRTVGFSAGPAISGQLVQWLGPALATVGTAMGFLWSAGWISAVRVAEPPPAVGERRLHREIAVGMRFVLREPFIRATTLYGAVAVAFLATRYSVETLFLLRTVGLPPAWIGLLLAVAGLGTVAGAAAAGPVARRVGEIRAVAGSAVAMGLCSLLIPLTTPGPGLVLYAAGAGLVGFWIVVNNVIAVSVRQRRCPDELLGRVTATTRFVSWALLPLGGVFGGALATALGLRTTLWVTAVGLVLCSVGLVRGLVAGTESAAPDPGRYAGRDAVPDPGVRGG